MEGHAVRTIDELPSIHDGAVKLAGAELGIRSFGLQVLDFPPGFAHYPAHDHVGDGQEEVYVVLHGRADFELNGELVPAGAGTILRVDPATRRSLTPGPEGVRILAIGCTTDARYERPEGFRLAAHA